MTAVWLVFQAVLRIVDDVGAVDWLATMLAFVPNSRRRWGQARIGGINNLGDGGDMLSPFGNMGLHQGQWKLGIGHEISSWRWREREGRVEERQTPRVHAHYPPDAK